MANSEVLIQIYILRDLSEIGFFWTHIAGHYGEKKPQQLCKQLHNMLVKSF